MVLNKIFRTTKALRCSIKKLVTKILQNTQENTRVGVSLKKILAQALS